MLPESRGTTYILRVLSIYRDLYKNSYGCYPFMVMGKFGKLLKGLIDNYSELQIAALMIIFFEWHGMDGSDDFAFQKIIDSAHNFGWFFSTVNSYEIYVRNVLHIDFDNEEKVREFVYTHMTNLSTAKN